MKTFVFVMVVILLANSNLMAQSCSCSRSSLDAFQFSRINFDHPFYVQLSHNWHNIDDLVSGSDVIHDQTQRQRATQTTEWALYYTSAKWYGLVLKSRYIEHSRQNSGGIEQITKGWGDISLKGYGIKSFGDIDRPHTFTLGLELFAPTGDSDVTIGGLLASEDMQPGLGVWGYGLQLEWFHPFGNKKFEMVGNLSYLRWNENERQLQNGASFTAGVGLQYAFHQSWGVTAGLRYRQNNADSRNGAELPNSGGYWLDATAGVHWKISKRIQFSIDYSQPIYRNLKGAIQYSTNQVLALRLLYRL